MPYISAATGAKLVLLTPGLDGDSIIDLIDGDSGTLALSVQPIWLGHAAVDVC